MKKFFALLLVLLLLPLVSLADDPVILSEHYSVFISGSANRSAGKGALFPFDSYSADLFIAEGGSRGYLMTSKCFSGLFISSGMVSVTIAESDGVLYIADDRGNYVTATRAENGTDLWITLENCLFRMQPVPSFSVFNDWSSN